jgi:hypothetical protein
VYAPESCVGSGEFQDPLGTGQVLGACPPVGVVDPVLNLSSSSVLQDGKLPLCEHGLVESRAFSPRIGELNMEVRSPLYEIVEPLGREEHWVEVVREEARFVKP